MARAGRGLLRLRWLALALGLLACALGAKAWHDTMADPVVLRTRIALPGLAPDSPPLQIALISDIHVAGPDMPPERLERIVDQINGLKPDIVAIAGDLVSDKRTATHIYTPEEIVAPLGGLTPRLGTFVVPGNHDHWFDMPGLSVEVQRQGLILLANDAAQAGPLVIGGLDDDYTDRADLPATLARMDAFDGARLMLSHSPDPFPDLPDTVPLFLAGHTHCGQIRLPLIGALTYMSDYGDRYACGRVDEDNKTVIVGAGLGTSLLPLRFGTRPEIWMIEIVPEG